MEKLRFIRPEKDVSETEEQHRDIHGLAHRKATAKMDRRDRDRSRQGCPDRQALSQTPNGQNTCRGEAIHTAKATDTYDKDKNEAA